MPLSTSKKAVSLAVLVRDTTPDKTAWELLCHDDSTKSIELKKAPRLLTPDGFIIFLSVTDPPTDVDDYDGIRSQPFPGVEVILCFGKPAQALWSWAQQFGNNQHN